MEQKWTNNLNNDEFNFIQDTHYPILKRNAIEKIKAQLFLLGEEMNQKFDQKGFKISLGENYLEMPYVVLDYPKISGNDFPFLFRTFFWWGHPISYQILVQTEPYKKLIEAWLTQKEEGVFVWVGENLWDNNWQGNGFVGLNQLNEVQKEMVLNRNWFKLVGTKIIKKPDNLFNEAIGFYEFYIKEVLASK
ncbi:MAG: hypothetical protein K9H61_09375 [Bacteroidia bacterium]|nr:hypothetical protein [Bacteroidia bacterium]MCF8425339.1 hypothetical protein [Bacteroidia bacterium]MCF8447192.1 hypothetical protein [Bacteroidia bacterium]